MHIKVAKFAESNFFTFLKNQTIYTPTENFLILPDTSER